MSISVIFAFALGLLAGLAIDKKARKDRDERIKALEEQIKQNLPPVRVAEGAIENAIRDFDQIADKIEEQ